MTEKAVIARVALWNSHVVEGKLVALDAEAGAPTSLLLVSDLTRQSSYIFRTYREGPHIVEDLIES